MFPSLRRRKWGLSLFLGKWGLSLFLAFLAFCAFAEERVLQLADGEELRYRVITEPSESARGTALKILEHLAAGDIDAAAKLSNAPMRRYEVLRDYRERVGDEEFRRVFARYRSPANRIFVEAAIGPRRMLVWDLGEAGNHLAAQYYIEAGGTFVMDDIPHEERARLSRLLRHLRESTSR